MNSQIPSTCLQKSYIFPGKIAYIETLFPRDPNDEGVSVVRSLSWTFQWYYF